MPPLPLPTPMKLEEETTTGWLMMATRTRTSPGCTGGKAIPLHPVAFKLRRALPLRPATVAVRLVAETSKKRFNTYSRTLR